MIVKEKYKSKVIGGAMVRTINVNEITKNIKEMCIEANHYLSPDMDKAMKQAEQTEKSPLGKQILGQLQENLKIHSSLNIRLYRETLHFARSFSFFCQTYLHALYLHGMIQKI